MDLALRGKITDLNNFKLLNLLMILRSAGLIFKTRDMEKEIWLIPKILTRKVNSMGKQHLKQLRAKKKKRGVPLS